MQMSRSRRLLALVTSTAFLASLTAATVASPASAAKPKCQGLPATIVGTAKGEVIRGTARRDIIVARGGHDRIYGKGGNDVICAGGGNDTVYGGPGADRLWGQLGHDKLFGNSGNDFLAGQIGNDTLNGGINYDTCYQGTGSGPVLACERPAPPPPPPPAGPALIPMTGILAVAFSDIDGLPGYSTGDVLIAKLVDTDGNGPDAGDTIEMGRYPLNLDGSAFAGWIDQDHVVDSVLATETDHVTVQNSTGARLTWARAPAVVEAYAEQDSGLTHTSAFQDGLDIARQDQIAVDTSSPSAPQSAVYPPIEAIRPSDDAFVDVVLNY